MVEDSQASKVKNDAGNKSALLQIKENYRNMPKESSAEKQRMNPRVSLLERLCPIKVGLQTL